MKETGQDRSKKANRAHAGGEQGATAQKIQPSSPEKETQLGLEPGASKEELAISLQCTSKVFFWGGSSPGTGRSGSGPHFSARHSQACFPNPR